MQVVGVGPRLRLGEREGGEPAPGREVGEDARLLLVGPEEGDALEAHRLMDAEDDREGGVDLADRLDDPRVPGLREALASVLLGHEEAECTDLTEVPQDLIGDPALLLGPPGVVVLIAVLADPGVALPAPGLLLDAGPG